MKYLNIVVVLLLTACSSAPTGNFFEKSNLSPPPKGQAQLVLYKAKRTIAVPRDVDVYVNGLPKCVLPDGAFVIIPVNPGKNVIGFSLWDIPGTTKHIVNSQSGATNYIMIDYNRAKQIGGAFGFIGASIAGEESMSSPGPFIATNINESDAGQQLLGFRESHCIKPAEY